MHLHSWIVVAFAPDIRLEYDAGIPMLSQSSTGFTDETDAMWMM